MEKFDCIMYVVPNKGRAFCDGLRKLYCKTEECAFYKPRTPQPAIKKTKDKK